MKLSNLLDSHNSSGLTSSIWLRAHTSHGAALLPSPPMAEPGAQEIGPLAKLLSAGQITDKATSVLGISEGEQPGFRRCLCHPALAPCPWSVCPGLAEEGHKPH